MLKNIASLVGGTGFCLAISAASVCWAADPVGSPPASVQATAAHPARVQPLQPQMPNSTLSKLAGRGDPTGAVTVTNQDLTAVNAGNSIVANTVGSGAISLEGNAFSAFNGVGNILMNTGHNNNLQSTMNVTVIIGP